MKQVPFLLFKSNPSPASLSVYKAESRRLSKLVRLSRRQYESKLADGVNLVYLDFKKAFDSVNHRFLIAKLKSFGIYEAVPNWIKSYLSNRSYQVQIDGVLSEEAPCLSGVPTSSVIGPLLFL